MLHGFVGRKLLTYLDNIALVAVHDVGFHSGVGFATCRVGGVGGRSRWFGAATYFSGARVGFRFVADSFCSVGGFSISSFFFSGFMLLVYTSRCARLVAG